MKNNKLEVAVAVGAAARRKNSGTVSGVTTEGAAGNKLTTSVKRMESSEILSSVEQLPWQSSRCEICWQVAPAEAAPATAKLHEVSQKKQEAPSEANQVAPAVELVSLITT
ncbi:uncharacterized protein DS421_12g384650 [Arachis hypogaea]|nr:uncharacterized protein DS421_12g384650 [Arachis hypogaea]